MAQAQPERKTEEICVEKKEMKETTKPKNDSNKNSDSVSFKFNAQAPEFVPRSHTNTTRLPISGYFYPCFHYFGATASAAGGSDWIFVGDQDHAAAYLISNNPNHAMSICPSKNRGVLTDDLREKIIKQVLILCLKPHLCCVFRWLSVSSLFILVSLRYNYVY
jgi:La-related protein 7